MKSLLIGLLTLVLSACSYLPIKLSDQATIGFLRQATHELTSQDGSCTVVMVMPETALTAAHCIGNELKVNGYNAVVLKINHTADLALLGVAGQMCPCVPIAETNPKQDEYVAVIGYPLDLGQVVTEGRVQGLLPDTIEHVRAKYLMLITAPVIFGNSGGPVFALNDKYEFRVVGIVSAVAVAEMGFIGIPIPHLAFAVNTDTVRTFVSSIQR